MDHGSWIKRESFVRGQTEGMIRAPESARKSWSSKNSMCLIRNFTSKCPKSATPKGWWKAYKWSDKLFINWCRISQPSPQGQFWPVITWYRSALNWISAGNLCWPTGKSGFIFIDRFLELFFSWWNANLYAMLGKLPRVSTYLAGWQFQKAWRCWWAKTTQRLQRLSRWKWLQLQR